MYIVTDGEKVYLVTKTIRAWRQGRGDVLSGIIGGSFSQKPFYPQAACGAYLERAKSLLKRTNTQCLQRYHKQYPKAINQIIKKPPYIDAFFLIYKALCFPNINALWNRILYLPNSVRYKLRSLGKEKENQLFSPDAMTKTHRRQKPYETDLLPIRHGYISKLLLVAC